MKFIFLFLIFMSQNIFACRLHKFEFLIENKSIAKIDDYQLTELKKDNDKWIIGLKISKKSASKLNKATKNNIGKNLNLLLDKRPISTEVIVSELMFNDGNIKISASVEDKEAESLKQDCSNH